MFRRSPASDTGERVKRQAFSRITPMAAFWLTQRPVASRVLLRAAATP